MEHPIRSGLNRTKYMMIIVSIRVGHFNQSDNSGDRNESRDCNHSILFLFSFQIRPFSPAVVSGGVESVVRALDGRISNSVQLHKRFVNL